MTHCEKCIHYDMCKAEHDSLDGTVVTFFPNNEDCNFFKNKADFIEVVRCRDCKHRRETAHRSYCLPVFGLKQITNLNSFCSYGERSDT